MFDSIPRIYLLLYRCSVGLIPSRALYYNFSIEFSFFKYLIFIFDFSVDKVCKPLALNIPHLSFFASRKAERSKFYSAQARSSKIWSQLNSLLSCKVNDEKNMPFMRFKSNLVGQLYQQLAILFLPFILYLIISSII